MTTALSVADYLKAHGVTGNMQLQKLLYYAQAWHLAWVGRPLFTDEIEAWPMGPVVRVVWTAEKRQDITLGSPNLSEDEMAIIDAVSVFYGRIGGAALAEMTHSEAPWLEARDGAPEGARSTAAISQATMRRYFTEKALTGGDLPKAPVNVGQAHPNAVSAAAKRQGHRWRGALDALAKR
jgi:uncharacterized phage-associated protein